MRNPRRLSCLSWMAVFIAAARVHAEEPYQPPDEILRRPELRASGTDLEPQLLGLSDAIQLAARQNLGVELQREQAAGARADFGVAVGRLYEPSLTATFFRSSADTLPPVAVLPQGVVESQVFFDSWSTGLSTQLPTGAQLSANWINARTLSRASGAALTDPLANDSVLTLSLVQPLLKGFAFDLAIPRADLLRARFASRRAALEVRASLIATLKTTEDAYWDLLQALKEDEVRHASLELARQQRLLSEKQIEAGILPASDLIAADSTLAQRELAVVAADAATALAADRLRQVLNLTRSEWTRPIVPVDPPRYEEPGVNLDEAMALALKNRPDLEQGRVDIERTSLDLRKARADRLPELDVGLSYALVGQQDTFKRAFDEMVSNKVNSWTLSARFSWAPFMIAARAQVDSSLAAARAAQVQLERQRLDLLVELRDDLHEIEAASRQVRAAARFRELAKRALDVEQSKFQDGSSNNFFVGQRQAELAQAQVAELGAVIRHRKARTALEAATGTLIEARGVRLEVGSPAQGVDPIR